MALLKQFIVKGIALSLICIAPLAEAVLVTNNSDLLIAGSLRQAVQTINTNPNPAVNEITFSRALNINLTSGLLEFTTLKPTVTIFGLPGIKIHRNNTPENVIFRATTTNLHLVGNNVGADSNWFGSIESEGNSIILEQQTSSTYPGIISGGADLVCQGTGQTLTFNQASTYTGSTSIEGVTLKATVTNALPIGSSVNITNVGANTGHLEIGDGCTQTLAGLSGDNFVDIDNGSILEIASGADSTFGGVIDGPGGLVKNGTAMFELTGSNTYTGTTEILEGTLKANALNALPQASPVTVSDNGTLEVAANQTLQSISGNGLVTIDNAAALTAATVLDSNFAGNITTVGTGTFIKGGGANTLTLSGQSSGNLQLANAAGGVKIPTGGSWNGPVTIGVATLEMNGGTVTQAITGNGFPTSTLNVTDTFTPTAAIANVGSINVRAGDTFTINAGSEPTGFSNFNVDAGGAVNLNTNFTVPAAATLTNAGTFAMNNSNLLMGDNSILNSGTLSTAGSISRVGGVGYALNVQAGDTLTVNNAITGYTGLAVGNNSSVVLDNGGNLSNGIALGNGTFTFKGGSYTGDVVGAAGSAMNVNSTLVPPGAITTDTLDINAGGVFTPSINVITNTALNVRQGGKLLLTDDIVGGATVDNAGAITHNTNALRTIAGDFTQEANGTLNIGITNAGPGQYSQFQVNGNTVLNGGVMNIQLLSTDQITSGLVFDIITSTGGIAGGAVLPTVPKPSLFLGFRPVITGNRLQLIAERSGCLCINTVPALDGIAKKLDDLSGNDNFKPVLENLTQQTSQKAFENKLEQLAPMGLNGIHTAMAQGSGGAEQVLLRLDAVRTGTGGALARSGYAGTGYAAGDVMEDRGSFAPIIFGNSTKQSSIQGLSGYNAATAGFGFLGDAPISEHFRAGLGVSYANSVVRQANSSGSHTTIGSTQGMAYGSATYGRLFLDAVLSAGINNYKGKRSVSFMGPTATSRYNGFQYGAKVKTGFAIPCHRIEISPMAAVQYMHLNVGQYTEQGAGILNQRLSSMQASTVRVNLGGKIAERSQEGTFFPEFHAFYITDVKNPQVIITSRFVEGGGSFNSTSVAPPKHGVNLGASVTALISDDFTLSGGYDLEAKRSFKSHSASLKFKFLF